MASNARLRERRSPPRRQHVHGTGANAKANEEIVELGGVGGAAAVEARRARMVHQLANQLAARADGLEGRYVTQADAHAVSLAHRHDDESQALEKLPGRQTQTLPESNKNRGNKYTNAPGHPLITSIDPAQPHDEKAPRAQDRGASKGYRTRCLREAREVALAHLQHVALHEQRRVDVVALGLQGLAVDAHAATIDVAARLAG